MIHSSEAIAPDAERHEEYVFVDTYIETYPHLRGRIHELTAHVSA